MYELLWIVIAILAVFGINYYLMRDYDYSWYNRLNKPDWTPTGGFIGIMWTIIYISVGISWWLALRSTDNAYLRTLISVLFLVNLVFNVSWSYFFFNKQNTIIPLGIVGVLIFTLLLLIITIFPINKLAALLLLLYLGWLFVAGYLNSYIVNNN